MEQRPSWEANSFSASQETPRILWNPEVHFRIHKSPLPVSILSQLNLVHVHPSHFLKIQFNVILPLFTITFSNVFQLTRVRATTVTTINVRKIINERKSSVPPLTHIFTAWCLDTGTALPCKHSFRSPLITTFGGLNTQKMYSIWDTVRALPETRGRTVKVRTHYSKRVSLGEGGRKIILNLQWMSPTVYTDSHDLYIHFCKTLNINYYLFPFINLLIASVR
jgi:hypothetical protein